jgi:hypothetical protein
MRQLLGLTTGWPAAAVMAVAAVALQQQQVQVLLAAAFRGSCKHHLLDLVVLQPAEQKRLRATVQVVEASLNAAWWAALCGFGCAWRSKFSAAMGAVVST